MASVCGCYKKGFDWPIYSLSSHNAYELIYRFTKLKVICYNKQLSNLKMFVLYGKILKPALITITWSIQ